MTITFHELIRHNAELPTWFGVGGRADTLAAPADTEQLRDLLLAFADRSVRIIGDGANLLVDDDGVDGLVLSLARMKHYEARSALDASPDCDVILHAQAGVNLPRLILESVRAGLAGLEGLGGIPASVGGAIIMNAGGAYGQIADAVHTIHALTRFGDPLTIPCEQVNFDYRHSGLDHAIITAVDFRLRRVPAGAEPALRERLKEVMAYKKSSQPLAERSAGCVFKNPVVGGERTSAGRIIDECGCKGMSVGAASVSDRHANFIVTKPGCTAGNIIELMERVRERVRTARGITLQNEVVIWRRNTPGRLHRAEMRAGTARPGAGKP